MSNLRHLMNYDDDNNTAANNNGHSNYNTRRSSSNAFSINNLINGPVPSASNSNNNDNNNDSALPKLEYNYASPQQSAIYASGSSISNQVPEHHSTASEQDENDDDQDEEYVDDDEEKKATPTNRVSQEQILASFERIKTHFPAARIKKIMQSDEEIGKVAQATPIIVGRALEIFMANLVEVSVLQAKQQGVKRITASHVKSAIENTEQFDFLVEAVEKYTSLKN